MQKIKKLLYKYRYEILCITATIAILITQRQAEDGICFSDGEEPESIFLWKDMGAPVITAQNMPHIIALTFDDGPHSVNTTQILDYLNQEDVPATFFVLGCKAERNQSLIKRMGDEGHQIGSHGYDHTKFTKLSDSSLEEQLSQTDQIIKEITGEAPTVIRPPGGEISERVKTLIDRPLIFWSIDPRDWNTQNADKVASYVIKRAKPGDIILLHDIRVCTVKAVKKIVPALKAQGFTFVTIGVLLTSLYGEMYRSAK